MGGGMIEDVDKIIFRQDGTFVGELTQEQTEKLIGETISQLFSKLNNIRFALLSAPQDSTTVGYLPGIINIVRDEEENQIIIQSFNFISPTPGSLELANQAYVIILSNNGNFISASCESLS